MICSPNRRWMFFERNNSMGTRSTHFWCVIREIVLRSQAPPKVILRLSRLSVLATSAMPICDSALARVQLISIVKKKEEEEEIGDE